MKKLFITLMLIVFGLTGCNYRGMNCKVIKIRSHTYTIVCKPAREKPQCMIEPWMCGGKK